MRRRLNLLVLGVTSMVVIAFLVPLALLVRSQADQRARLAAERDVQLVANDVVRAVAAVGGDVGDLASAMPAIPSRVSVVVAGNRVIGQVDPFPALVDQAATAGQAQSAYTSRGWELALPVITRSEPIVVVAVVPEEELRSGVAAAWLMLAGLGLGVTVAALVVADRLGRTVVGPSQSLSRAALRLGRGDLDTRVDEDGPPELREVARAFNVLAARLRDLLAAEREQVADLSHRLRTPLTAVRLEAEALDDPVRRRSLTAQVDRLQRAVDDLITEARRRPEGGAASCDLAAVVEERVRFWQVLAEEEARPVELALPEGPVHIPVDAAEVAAAVDALVGNVFTHTDRATGFSVEVWGHEGGARLMIGDDGPGFPPGVDPMRRGVSTGSTGLGLDIARRLAERTGGGMTLGSAPSGGARVELSFGRERRGGGEPATPGED